MLTLLALAAGGPAAAQDPNQLIQQTCVACHNEYTLQAGLNLQGFDAENPHLSPVIAEKMIRKLRAGQMPPREMPRDEAAIGRLVTTLEGELDRHAAVAGRAGSRPFQRDTAAETMTAILREEPPELASVQTELPSGTGRRSQ